MTKDNDDFKLDKEYGVGKVVAEFTIPTDDLKKRTAQLEEKLDNYKKEHDGVLPHVIYLHANDRFAAKIDAMLLADILQKDYISLVPLQISENGFSIPYNIIIRDYPRAKEQEKAKKAQIGIIELEGEDVKEEKEEKPKYKIRKPASMRAPEYTGYFVHIEDAIKLEKDRRAMFGEMLDEIFLHYDLLQRTKTAVQNVICLSGEEKLDYKFPVDPVSQEPLILEIESDLTEIVLNSEA